MHMTITDDFSALGLSEQMLEAVRAKGFETPTAIQKLTIPHLLTKPNDIIAQSQTGTGKTAAYGLPILQTLEPARGPIQAIILVPTRELALQAAEELLSYNREKRLSITAIYGGAAMSEQLRRLAKGIDIVVGTPGRVLDHIRRGTMKLENVRYLVLDEADEMLNMGFVEDVEEIMSHTSDERRVLLFSATMPERIIRLSKTYMRDTEIVRVEHKQITADLTEQIYFEVREADKFDALTRIIDVEPEFYGIIFARTKIGADETASRLTARGYAAEVLHGDVSQAQREKILRKFRDRTINILVATDVAARGIDVGNLTHVINYSLPQDSESYVHRIGRTARAGRKGKAITFVGRRDFSLMSRIERFIGVKLTPEPVLTAVQVDQLRTESLVDDILERLKPDAVLPEELKEVEAEPEAMAAALFDLLRERTHREVQPIPEDKPARRARRMPQTGEEAESPQKGDSWQHKGDTVTLFMNGGRMIGLRPKDIAGLFYNTVEMEKGAVGDIRIFPKHSLIEVDASVAPLLLEALATATVCGYEVNVREDKGAPEYSGTPRSSRRNGGFRNSYRGERDRSDRSGFRGNRGGFRSDRGERWGERSRRDDRKKRF